MKRIIAVILLAVTVLTLAACTAKPKGTDILTVEKNGKELFVIYNYEEQTISVGETLSTVYGPDGELIWEEDRKDRYRYEYDNGNITIYYPNGATWWESSTATGAIGGWDGDYDTDRYIEGDFLARQITKAYNTPRNWDNVVIIGLVSLIMIGVGVVSIKHPEFFYELRYGLWFENVEPTDFALSMSRIGGVICIVAAVVMFLVVLFG